MLRPSIRWEVHLLQIEHLTKIYADGTLALDDVSFDVVDGEFLVVLGLSGAGKSTLLRCINRLVEPTSGTITWDGEDVTAASGEELRMIRRHIGMIFQEFNLVERSSVLTNVLAGRLAYVNSWLSLFGRFPKEEMERAIGNLERMDISDLAEKRADELSGGQRQRVGIARALMQEPRLMLADEPVASLDPVLAHSILRYLERLNKEDGITVICSLHFLDLVRRYATRVVALRDGRVVFQGLPEEITDVQGNLRPGGRAHNGHLGRQGESQKVAYSQFGLISYHSWFGTGLRWKALQRSDDLPRYSDDCALGILVGCRRSLRWGRHCLVVERLGCLQFDAGKAGIVRIVCCRDSSHPLCHRMGRHQHQREAVDNGRGGCEAFRVGSRTPCCRGARHREADGRNLVQSPVPLILLLGAPLWMTSPIS